MRLSTTGVINEKRYKVLGLVAGTHVLTLSALRKFLSAWSGVVGTDHDYSGIEKKFLQARKYAEDKMVSEAEKMGADEVIGVRTEMSEVGPRDTVLVCVAYGTAIKRRSSNE